MTAGGLVKVAEPSWWTDGVFEGRPIRGSLAVRDFGAVFRFLKTRGWSRAAIASATGLTETRVRAVAQGKQQITSYEVIERIAGGLNIDRGLLGLAYAEPNYGASPNSPAADREPPTQTVPGVGNAEHVGAMRSFRSADRQVGGGHLYATVIKYLHTEVAPRLFGDEQETDDGLSFTAAAALTEMAGWMAHDAGRDQVAARHFSRSLHLAKLGAEQQFQAQVLASLSHLANHQGHADEAIRYARQGSQALTDGPRHPSLQGRLLAMQARGFAALGQAEHCVQLLHRAETALDGPPADQQSPWISPFDEASLASEAARCLRQLGDLSQAQRQTERIIALRPTDRIRSRAFGQLILVTILIARGRVEAACAVAHEILDATPHLGSGLVGQQLSDLQRLLAPYRDTTVVKEFLARLADVLSERAWLYRWLTDGHDPRSARRGQA
jgi:transcriptional regulator with XRE-family HTH domain